MAENGRVSTETVVVGHAGGRELRADLYRPPVPNGAGLVLIHGGSYITGDRTQLRGYGIFLGRLGYTSLACEYRLAGEAQWPAQIDDAHLALGFLHDRAPALSVDASKIAMLGNSAGGQLALLAAGLRISPVAAAIALYAATDFLGPGARAKGAPEAMSYLVGEDTSEAKLASISPVTYVNASFPPTLLLTGNRDEVVDWHDSVDMYLRLMGASAQCELHIFDGAPHAFDASPEYGRQCADLIALFLDRHVLHPTGATSPSSVS